MRALKVVGNAVLTVVALLGVCSALVWGATAAGRIQPLIVVSGSMEPEIMTGDLLVAVPLPVDEIEVGRVLSLRSEVTGDIVTHRVIEVSGVGGSAAVRMQGDGNEAPDGETYEVSGTVWAPEWQISGGGFAVRTLTRPNVAVPLLVAILACIGLTAMSSRPEDDDETDGQTAADEGIRDDAGAPSGAAESDERGAHGT